MEKTKFESALLHAAADFINRESNRQSLITVTQVSVDERGLRARVYVSVFPDQKAEAALDFLSRKTDDFRLFVKKHIRSRALPQFEFIQDPNVGGLQVGEDQKIA